MSQTSQTELDREISRISRRLPDRLARLLHHCHNGASRWVRIPIGLGLIVGGVFSFLPVLGVWMIPLGLVVMAKDVPPLRRPMARMLAWIEGKLPAQR